MQSDFDAVRAEMDKEALRGAKLEQRVGMLTGGYIVREKKLNAQLDTLWQTLQTSQQARHCPLHA